MSEINTLIGYGNATISREELALILTPGATDTSAFKELDPIPPFKATSKLGPFFGARSGVLTGARYTDLLASAGLLNTKPRTPPSICWENVGRIAPGSGGFENFIPRDDDTSTGIRKRDVIHYTSLATTATAAPS
jgi:hypothetical protein